MTVNKLFLSITVACGLFAIRPLHSPKESSNHRQNASLSDIFYHAEWNTKPPAISRLQTHLGYGYGSQTPIVDFENPKTSKKAVKDSIDWKPSRKKPQKSPRNNFRKFLFFLTPSPALHTTIDAQLSAAGRGFGLRQRAEPGTCETKRLMVVDYSMLCKGLYICVQDRCLITGGFIYNIYCCVVKSFTVYWSMVGYGFCLFTYVSCHSGSFVAIEKPF